MRTPRAVRPIQHEYVTIGEVLTALKYDLYENITLENFTMLCMLASRGSMNPNRAKDIYYTLMNEAGLEPLYEDMKNES